MHAPPGALQHELGRPIETRLLRHCVDPPSVELLKEGTMGAMCMLAARIVCKSACICPGEVSDSVLWNCDNRSDDIANVSSSALEASGMLPMAA